ncbi:AzlD domain-containing protein [Ramlibacter humi]|uniref:AzlD domain-containing protein n=1 Tax=Ramlibacter humi TaxID=2530451 RepID=A0A4Z0BUE0_9BURK|nr:AzlD domain-containing protein [Ramlibacter humi]TFZ02020.1 AzlD domain-containing protein [Ramlibacter humi]
MTDLWTVGIILALAAVTVLARGFFFISERDWSLPRWAERGLQYAPIAALAAVVMPEIFTVQGKLIQAWDARVFGAIAGVAAFYWRRSVLATIGAGMLVYLPLHLGLGW